MGWLLHFFAGDPNAAGEALAAADAASLRQGQFGQHHVDLSLHLTHIDLDLLTAEASALVGDGPSSFMDSLQEHMGGDGEECGSEIVAPEWVRMMASLTPVQLEPLLQRWREQMVAEYNDPSIAVTPDVRKALAELVTLCQAAVAERLPVIHVWSL